MHKKRFFKAVVLIVLILIIFFIAIIFNTLKQDRVCFNSVNSEKCFYVEIADTHEERELGLKYQGELSGDKGMLFIFDEPGIYSFSMKDTIIPLDLIWMDKEMEIVHISKNQTPCTILTCPVINSNLESLYVLEIDSGKSDKLNLKIGDKLIIDRINFFKD